MKRLVSVILSVALALGLAPGMALATEVDGNGDYTVTFTDADTRGGWRGASGEAVGAVTFVDGAMRVAKQDSDNTEKMLAYDAAAPTLADGFVELDMTNDDTNGRMGVLFRYEDATHYAGLCYDVGNNWKFISDGVDVSGITFTNAPALTSGTRTHIRVEFTGERVKAVVGGAVIYDGAVPGLRTQAGRMGIITWGYEAGRNQGKCLVDNTTCGQLPVREEDGSGNYTVTFTDAQRRGGFQVVSGDGDITFADGADSAGYMVLAKRDGTTSKTVAVAAGSPAVRDGFVEMDVTNDGSAGRIGVVFRHDGAQYATVAYDVGTWKITKGETDLQTNLTALQLTNGVTRHVRVDFVRGKITLTVDGTRAFSQNCPELAGMDAGRVGVIAWGYDAGVTQGKIKVDNVVVGELGAVELTPSVVSRGYSDAAGEDVTVTLSATENPLTGISLGGTALAQGVDYTCSGAAVTLRKEVITQELRDAGGGVFTFTFADGFETELQLRISAKPLESQISYQRDFSADVTGAAGFTRVSGSGEMVYNPDTDTLSVGAGMFIDQSSPVLKNCDVEFDLLPLADGGSFSLVARYTGADSYVSVGSAGPAGRDSHHNNWNVTTAFGTERDIIPSKDGGLFQARSVPYRVRVRFLENTYTIWVEGEEVYSGASEALLGGVGKAGILVTGQGYQISGFRVTSADPFQAETATGGVQTISSSELTVTLDAAFPRVVSYQMAGKTLPGQELPYYKVELNGRQFKPTVTASFAAGQATYHTVVEVEAGKTVAFDVVFSVSGNALQMDVTHIQDETWPVYTLNFPRHSLVSMPSTAAGAHLHTANYTRNNVDSELDVDLADRGVEDTYRATTLAVLSGGGLAASINNGSYNVHRAICFQTVQSGGHTSTGLWSNGFTYRGLDGQVIEEPWVRVAVTGDRNGDNVVDDQDGAIARRDDCLKDGTEPDIRHSEAVMGRLNTVAMNVGSAAQYPFLRILDNIQKVSLGVDGFPQTVIIKGYNGQGHDSNNGDFANYNKGAGGLADFNTLLNTAEGYNAKIGIHVNHTEVYPESATFGSTATTVGGWSWYDASKIICREDDALNQSPDGMYGRLEKLNADTNGKLAVVYVDVYYATRWAMYALTNKLNDLGIAVATEYANEMDRQSAWSHHIGEGEIQEGNAGNLIRFVSHTDQDIFGNSPLFRTSGDTAYGRNNIGINGWQLSKSYSHTMEDFFTDVLPNSFLTQYPIMKWAEDNSQVVLGRERNVVTRMEGNTNVITLDGNEVARGDLVFIPYTVSGVEKIYHWNPTGGSSTWTLPASFAGQATVKLFQLSDHGRTNLQTLNVTEGRVTVNAAARTGYVLYKGDAQVGETDLSTLEWTQGSPVRDAGFDSFTPGYAWTVENGQFENNNNGNTYLTFRGAGAGAAVQTLAGMTAGRTYQASVWAEVSGKTATLTVEPGTGEIVSNYIDRSDVVYGLHHTDKQGRNLQRVSVFFTAQSATARLTLSASAGTGSGDFALFDDVRVVENTPSDAGTHTWWEDFENVDEGFGLFTSTESDNAHLAQRNDPYTDDVIAGEFSWKVWANHGDYLRTLPHTVRLKPNTRYTVGLDYRIDGTPASKGFVLAAKSGEDGSTLASAVCGSDVGWRQVEHAELQFVTGDDTHAYIDITKAQNGSGTYVIDNFYVDELRVVDKAALQALCSQCSGLAAADYTPESFAALSAKLTAAQAVAGQTAPTQEALNRAYDELTDAKNALVPYAAAGDFARLQGVIDRMEEVQAADFKADSAWSAFQAQIAAAKTLLTRTEPRVTVPEVDRMAEALQLAREGLHSVLNLAALQALYDTCAAIDNNHVVDNNDRNAFMRAKTAAAEALAAPGMTQEDVDGAYDALLDAYGRILPTDTAPVATQRQAKLAAAKAVKNPSAALTAAIAQGESARTWKEMAEAVDALTAAIPSGGNTGGNTGGSTGGSTGGNTGGSTGGSTGGNAGGSTGGSGSHSGSTMPVENRQNVTVATPAVSAQNNAAELTLKQDQVKALADAARENGSGEMVVDLAVSGQADKVAVTLPVQSVKGTDQVKLTVKTPLGGVTWTAQDLGKVAGDLHVTLERQSDGSVRVDTDASSVLARLHAGDGNVAALVGEDGATELLPKSLVVNGEAVVRLPGGGRVAVLDNAKHFADVAENHWAAKSVDFVAAREIFQGTGGDNFSPAGNMTRGMVAAILHRLEGKPGAVQALTFPDVAEGSWYTDAVRWGAEKGLLAGRDGGQFQPDADVTRQELTVMLCRYAAMLGIDVSADRAALEGFADKGDVPDWAADAMSFSVKAGWIVGGDRGLAPAATATRAEVAKILERFVTFLLQ